jgi:hypothetical protein
VFAVDAGGRNPSQRWSVEGETIVRIGSWSDQPQSWCFSSA